MGKLTLAVHCKKSEQVDLKKPVWSYVANTYGQHQADDAADDLAHVQQLRNTVCGLTGSLSSLRETLAKCVLKSSCNSRCCLRCQLSLCESGW